jgi:hypothetical protein
VAARKHQATKKVKPDQLFGSKGVFYKLPQGAEGPMEIRFDFSQISPPDKYYYADCLHLRVDEEMRMAILAFGHRNENTDKFSDRIDVVMPTNSLFGVFCASATPVEEAVDKILQASGTSVDLRPLIPTETEAPTLFANIIFAAAGDGESSLDFYHLSPREVHLAKTQRTDMEIEATVRVIMSTVLTKYFFNVLRPHAQRITYNQPILERNTSVARAR